MKNAIFLIRCINVYKRFVPKGTKNKWSFILEISQVSFKNKHDAANYVVLNNLTSPPYLYTSLFPEI
jgi:hypothetical protein